MFNIEAHFHFFLSFIVGNFGDLKNFIPRSYGSEIGFDFTVKAHMNLNYSYRHN